MEFIIVLPETLYTEIRTFLLRDPNREQFGYLFAGDNTTDSFVKLLGHTFLPAQNKEDLDYQNTGGICPSPKFQMKAYSISKKQGYHLIDLHSHPFDSSRNVRFSSIDDRYEFGNGKEGVFGFTSKWNPGKYHASIVFGQNSLDARIYRPEQGAVVPIDKVQVLISKTIIPTSSSLRSRRSWQERMEVTETVIGENSAKKKENGGNSGSDLNSVYSRQILAFGKMGQEALASASIAVIGAGGLGSIIVETLARLGAREIICVDDDTIEPSNISRVLGSKFEDGEKRSKKVDVLGRQAREINPRLEYTPIADSILNPAVLARLKRVDFIISGTDTYSSRLVINRWANQYLIPHIDLGFGMETDSSRHSLVSAGGKVITYVPGNWCFQCLGEINQRELQLELMSAENKERQIARGYITGVDIPNPSVIFLNMIVASLGICEFMNLLTPFKERDCYLFYDMLATKLWKMHVKKNPDCPTCSPEAEILGRGDLIALEDIRELSQSQSLPDRP